MRNVRVQKFISYAFTLHLSESLIFFKITQAYLYSRNRNMNTEVETTYSSKL